MLGEKGGLIHEGEGNRNVEIRRVDFVRYRNCHAKYEVVPLAKL